MSDEQDESPRWGTGLEVAHVLGAPCKGFIDRPRSVGSLLSDARRRPDELYLVEGDRRLTFACHEAAVRAVRRELEAAGVAPGDAVMILGANRIELVTTFWAILRAGAVAVMANAWWSDAEIAAALGLIDPRLVVCDSKRAALLPAGRPYLSYEHLQHVSAQAPLQRDEDHAVVDEDAPALVIFTSGTTGFAKAATLSHRGVIATLQSLLVVTRRLPGCDPDRTGKAVSLLTLPLFHVGGLQQVITSMVTGGCLVFNVGRFDAESIVDLLEREDVRAWSTVPTMAARVLDHLERTGRSLPALRTIGMGGSPVPENLRERVRTALPQARRGVGVTWGLTEAGGVVTTGAGEGIEARPGTVGRLLPTSEVRVDAADNGVGELLVRSPSVMLGYWNASESPIDAERWLRTGDIGWIDEDDYVYVSDRAKDIVIRGGENIAAAHVEDVIGRHAAVAEVAVFGLPDVDLGEALAAVVRLHQHAEATSADLEAFAARSLAHFEVPSMWWLRERPLPQNASGKILKQELRREWFGHLAAGGDDVNAVAPR